MATVLLRHQPEPPHKNRLLLYMLLAVYAGQTQELLAMGWRRRIVTSGAASAASALGNRSVRNWRLAEQTVQVRAGSLRRPRHRPGQRHCATRTPIRTFTVTALAY